MCLAGSFSQTYKRNAINNGFLVLETPELVDDMKNQHGTDQLSVKTNSIAKVDFKTAIIIIEKKEYTFSPIGKAAQELILTEGLENWVKKNIN